MGQGILCRSQHSSTHKVQVCCSEIRITSKHSSRHTPSGLSGSVGMGDREIPWLAQQHRGVHHTALPSPAAPRLPQGA